MYSVIQSYTAALPSSGRGSSSPSRFLFFIPFDCNQTHSFGYKPPHTPRAPPPLTGSFSLPTAVGFIQAPTSSCVACSPPLSHWPPALSTEDSSSHLPQKGFPRSSAALSLRTHSGPGQERDTGFTSHGPSPLGLVTWTTYLSFCLGWGGNTGNTALTPPISP